MTDPFLYPDVDRMPVAWLPVPIEWPAGDDLVFDTVDEWSAYAADALWDAASLGRDPQGVEGLTRVLAHAAEHFPESYPGFDLFLHLPDPRDNPLPVFLGEVDVDDLDAEEVVAELRSWTAEDPDVVEPPVEEEFISPHLGKGVRVLRYSNPGVDPDGDILVGLRYAWHAPEFSRLAVLITASYDPGRVLTAMDDIDDLARCLRYDAAPTA